MERIPNEETVTAHMRANIGEHGLYLFPSYEESPEMSAEERQAVVSEWEEKYKAGPTGILVYNPQGSEPLSTGQLGRQLLSDILAALVAAFLLTQAVPALRAYGARVLFVVLLSVFGLLNVSTAYWNWFNFPTDYTLASMANELIGWALAGSVLAAIIKPSGD